MIDTSPKPQAPTSLERTLEGFAKRNRENQIEKQETDALSEIYSQFKREGEVLDDAIFALQTKPGLSPTTRVNSANQLLNLKKTNASLQAKADKAKKELEKQDLEAELDQKELDFLDSVKGEKLKPTEIYIKARKNHLPHDRAYKISTLHRLEEKEGRLSEADIAKQYDFEIKEIDKEIKETASDRKKKPLQDRRRKLIEQRNQDIKRFRENRDEDFTISMHEPEQAEEEQAEEDPLIQLLTNTFPPSQVPKGTVKWLPADKSPDGKKHKFESDGKTWRLIS